MTFWEMCLMDNIEEIIWSDGPTSEYKKGFYGQGVFVPVSQVREEMVMEIHGHFAW